jgi:hypothetical protein
MEGGNDGYEYGSRFGPAYGLCVVWRADPRGPEAHKPRDLQAVRKKGSSASEGAPMKNRLSQAQLSCLHVKWTQLRGDNDPRTEGPRRQVYDHDRDGRIAWAKAHIGIKGVASFSDLTPAQAGYLLDILGGKKTKLDGRLDMLFRQAGIEHPAEWFEVVMSRSPGGRGKGMWLFAGFTLSELSHYQKWRLCELLSTRGRVQEAAHV